MRRSNFKSVETCNASRGQGYGQLAMFRTRAPIAVPRRIDNKNPAEMAFQLERALKV